MVFYIYLSIPWNRRKPKLIPKPNQNGETPSNQVGLGGCLQVLVLLTCLLLGICNWLGSVTMSWCKIVYKSLLEFIWFWDIQEVFFLRDGYRRSYMPAMRFSAKSGSNLLFNRFLSCILFSVYRFVQICVTWCQLNELRFLRQVIKILTLFWWN